jgi:dihydrofolate reductase
MPDRRIDCLKRRVAAGARVDMGDLEAVRQRHLPAAHFDRGYGVCPPPFQRGMYDVLRFWPEMRRQSCNRRPIQATASRHQVSIGRKKMPTRVEMPSLSFVVARSSPGNIIGCDNKLPWHLRADLVRFKAITMGHVIIMGRKTHESIGRVLPGRITIVLSRRPDTERENTIWGLRETSLLWAGDRENALFLADFLSISKDKKDFFVIGGAEVFLMFSELFNKIYLTEVLADVPGDALFDLEFKYPYWKKVSEEMFPKSDSDEYPSRFSIFEKRDKTTRFRRVPEFLTDATARREWVKQNLPNLTAGKPEDSIGYPTGLLFPEEER